VALDRFEACATTGRFVASHEGQIVGGGRWIDSIDYTQHASQTEGVVFWFTELSGSGKSTLANALRSELKNKGRNVVVLDGDELRTGLCRDLGYSANDRQENLRRAAEVTKLFADNGSIVITAFISPLQAYREMARTIIGADRFHEIFIDAPLAVCEQRDPKGL
jgi:adenylylsulfate kinase